MGNLIKHCASKRLQELYLPQLASGVAYGTMCLSEPHAGSSLTDIRYCEVSYPLSLITRRCSAVLSDFDSHKSYLIKGSKMWISGGDQGFSENIVSRDIQQSYV